MGGLSDLDFSHGLEFQRLVVERFGTTVSFSHHTSSREFFLVSSFGRSAIRLNCESVTLILQSCLGGHEKDYNVIHLSDMMLHFSVNSKAIGFMIHRLSSFSLALCLPFSSLCGGIMALIGAKNMIDGALNKKRSGFLPLILKNPMLRLSRIHPIQRMFLNVCISLIIIIIVSLRLGNLLFHV